MINYQQVKSTVRPQEIEITENEWKKIIKQGNHEHFAELKDVNTPIKMDY